MDSAGAQCLADSTPDLFVYSPRNAEDMDILNVFDEGTFDAWRRSGCLLLSGQSVVLPRMGQSHSTLPADVVM